MTPYTPHQYQQRAIQFGVTKACAGFFLEPGLGKSSIALATYHVLRKQGLIDTMLIVAPLRVCYSTWISEPAKWDFSHGYSVGLLHGKNKEDVLNQKHDIYVINYDGLEWLADAVIRKTFPFHMLVADESTKLKHCNTRRFKTIKRLLPNFRRRYILTGSPAPNGLMDLFGQMYVMDMGATFGSYITHYRNNFFFPTGYGGYEWKLKPGAADAINKAMAPKVITMRAEDYLTLPDLVESDVWVTLPDKARRIYDQMEDALLLEFKAGRVTAVNSGVATMKTRQIAAGGVYGDDGSAHHVHDAKTDALEDLIEELSGQPALVAFEFKHDLERILRRFPKTPYIGDGGVTLKQMPDLIAKWNAGDIPVLLANPASMSHGVDGLQGAGKAVIWYTPTYNLEYREQFIRRIWRQGQKSRVFVYNILADKTIDVAVMQAVKSKDGVQNGLLNALKKYWQTP